MTVAQNLFLDLHLIVVLGVHEVIRIAALIHEFEIVRFHRRLFDRVGGAKAVLEIVAGAKILELRLHHRAEIARRVMAELYYAARITLEDQDHSTPDLGGRHCHILLFRY